MATKEVPIQEIEPLQVDIERFVQMVEKIRTDLIKDNPDAPVDKLCEMAERLAAEMFFGSEDEKRPN